MLGANLPSAPNKMHTSLQLFPIQNNEIIKQKFIFFFKSRNFKVNEEKCIIKSHILLTLL